jgi:hypothetical protein
VLLIIFKALPEEPPLLDVSQPATEQPIVSPNTVRQAIVRGRSIGGMYQLGSLPYQGVSVHYAACLSAAPRQVGVSVADRETLPITDQSGREWARAQCVANQGLKVGLGDCRSRLSPSGPSG